MRYLDDLVEINNVSDLVLGWRVPGDRAFWHPCFGLMREDDQVLLQWKKRHGGEAADVHPFNF